MLSVTEFVGVVATAFSLLQNGIILLIVKRIRGRGSSDHFSFFPYCANFASSICWLKYALLIFDMPLIFSNIFSAVISGFIILLFFLYSQMKFNLLYPTIIGSFLISIGLFFNVIDSVESQISFLQVYCPLMSVLAFGAPLSAITSVWRSKSLNQMSFSLCFSNFLIGILWVTYGILKNDYSLMICNLLGTCLSVCQLSLYLIIPFVAKLSLKNEKILVDVLSSNLMEFISLPQKWTNLRTDCCICLKSEDGEAVKLKMKMKSISIRKLQIRILLKTINGHPHFLKLFRLDSKPHREEASRSTEFIINKNEDVIELNFFGIRKCTKDQAIKYIKDFKKKFKQNFNKSDW